MIDWISPKWDKKDFYNLDYELAPYHSETDIDLYVKSGHHRDSLTIYKYHQPSEMPYFVDDYIIPKVSGFLDNVAIAFNLFKPGQYLPYHKDTYTKYKEVFDINNKKIQRIILMLEDWSPGQIITIENKSYSGWKAGKCYSWEEGTYHTFYNLGLENRYAIQITGTLK